MNPVTQHLRTPILLPVMALTSLRLLAGQGFVETFEGRRHYGHVRLASNTVHVIRPQSTTITQVPLTNLWTLRLFTRTESLPLPNALPETDVDPIEEWHHQDVGNLQPPGNSLHRYARLELRAGASEIGSTEDAFRFVGQEIHGDCEIAARVLRLDRVGYNIQAGLMIRESMHPDARNVYLGRTHWGGQFTWRDEPGRGTRRRSSPGLTHWLRLKRDGNRFLAFVSGDGRRWRVVDTTEVAMADDVWIGVVMAGGPALQTRHNKDGRSGCWLDHVTMGRGLRLHPYTPRITLQSGTEIVSDIGLADPMTLHLRGAPARDAIPLNLTSRIDFQWMPPHLAYVADGTRAGALIGDGQFFQGTLREMRTGTCEMNTLGHGVRRFDAHHEIIRLVIQPPKPVETDEIVGTWNGTKWRGTILSIEPGGIRFKEPSLGELTIPVNSVKWIERR